MLEINTVSGVAHAIQMAVAPVFLLSAIAMILNVLTNRLGRITDRVRVLEAKIENASTGEAATLQAEVSTLSKRAKLIDYAITLSTITSILVCSVIAILFLGVFLQFDINITVMVLFISAMFSLVLALLFLLREILMATLKLVAKTSQEAK
jgi:cell division protein FtsL